MEVVPSGVVNAGVHVCAGVGGDAFQPARKRVVVRVHPILPGIGKNGPGRPGSEHPAHDVEDPLDQGAQMGIVMMRAMGLNQGVV